MELIRCLLAYSRGRGAEQSVDDEVGDAGKVVEARDQVLTERQTGDKQLEGLAGDLTVDAGDVGLLGAQASVEGEVRGAVVTARAAAGPGAGVPAVAANIHSLRSGGGSDTNLEKQIMLKHRWIWSFLRDVIVRCSNMNIHIEFRMNVFRH